MKTYSEKFKAATKIGICHSKNISRVPNNEEVWATIKKMKILKSPGQDGMPALFYKRCWEFIGDDVINMVKIDGKKKSCSSYSP